MLKFLTKSVAPIAIVAALAACGEANDGAATAPTAGGDASGSAAAAQTGASAEKSWVRTMTKTAEGGYRIGNPDAPVKLVEFGSLSCSHCATFHEEAMQELKGEYIASGDVSYELRTFVLNPPDLLATLLARCSTPEAFFALSDAFFENQQSWFEPFTQLTEAQQNELQSMDPKAGRVRFAEMGELDEFVRARGIPASKFRSCIDDESGLEELDGIRQSAIEDYELTGTPTFVLNGERIDANRWDQVKTAIDGAL